MRLETAMEKSPQGTNSAAKQKPDTAKLQIPIVSEPNTFQQKLCRDEHDRPILQVNRRDVGEKGARRKDFKPIKLVAWNGTVDFWTEFGKPYSRVHNCF